MSVMSLPGFTAEASVYKTRVHYQTARTFDQGNRVSGRQLTPQSCLPVGDSCSWSSTGTNECCTGWCNENNRCDCFDLGDECRLGPRSCCSGTCIDGICGPPATINVSWIPFGNGVNGLVIVTGRNFTANSQFRVYVTNCEMGGGPAGPIVRTDANGEFTTWVQCFCRGVTNVSACDQSFNCAQGSAPMPC